MSPLDYQGQPHPEMRPPTPDVPVSTEQSAATPVVQPGLGEAPVAPDNSTNVSRELERQAGLIEGAHEDLEEAIEDAGAEGPITPEEASGIKKAAMEKDTDDFNLTDLESRVG